MFLSLKKRIVEHTRACNEQSLLDEKVRCGFLLVEMFFVVVERKRDLYRRETLDGRKVA